MKNKEVYNLCVKNVNTPVLVIDVSRCDRKPINGEEFRHIAHSVLLDCWRESEYDYKGSILDSKEKEFLQYLCDHIQPKIIGFSKVEGVSYKSHYKKICGLLETGDAFFLPVFKEEDMYRKMHTNREYSLMELGLTEHGKDI